jgi:hypothetical protein
VDPIACANPSEADKTTNIATTPCGAYLRRRFNLIAAAFPALQLYRCRLRGIDRLRNRVDYGALFLVG